MKLSFISTIFFLTTLSCGSTKINSHNTANLNYILFGVYCGKCTGHCATMYQYNIGNSNTLFVDTTDSFLKNNEDVICQMQIHDSKKIELAKNVVQKIPDELLTTTEETKRFGCPNCADQCGIYFEIKQKAQVKKFYIDVDTSQLSGNMKSFSEFLKTTINTMKGRE
jgi:hypothetical protein